MSSRALRYLVNYLLCGMTSFLVYFSQNIKLSAYFFMHNNSKVQEKKLDWVERGLLSLAYAETSGESLYLNWGVDTRTLCRPQSPVQMLIVVTMVQLSGPLLKNKLVFDKTMSKGFFKHQNGFIIFSSWFQQALLVELDQTSQLCAWGSLRGFLQ